MAVPRATLGWPGRSRPGSDELFGLLVRSWQLDGSFQLLGMSFANMEQDVDRVEEPVYTQLRRQHFWLRQRVLLKCRKRLPMLRCSQRNRLASGRDLRLRAGKGTGFSVQLEVMQDGIWKPVRRGDDHHGRPHIDYYNSKGEQVHKEWLDCDRNEALTRLRSDFKENWERYAAEFLEESTS